MLDVLDFIAERGGNPEKVRESQRTRNASVEVVDEIIAMWQDHRSTQYDASQIGSRINAVQKEIGLRKRAKENADDLLAQKKQLEAEKESQQALATDKMDALNKKLKTIGNYVHPSVPVSTTEDENRIERTWKPESERAYDFDLLSHHEVLTRLDGYDSDRGVKVVGHRGYCLTNYGLFLNLALVNYGLEFLFNRGYTPNQPPFFMLRDQMAKTAQLEQFDEELYKVSEDDNEANDKYLIATSEQPLSVLHSAEWLQDSDLPIKYAGYSTNFRKEAGSHGKDAWGIFRVHQFEKIEQFVLCHPEKSWHMFDDMIAVAEEFYRSLGLPYQVVSIVSGALNNAAAKKFDLEAWFPFQSEYKELVSCSNCTDYQTRELDIRYGVKTATSTTKTYAHALNATLCATERALCCILENYQKADGIEVPEVLRKYIPGQPDFLPYVKELPKNTTSQRVKEQKKGAADNQQPMKVAKAPPKKPAAAASDVDGAAANVEAVKIDN